MKIVGKVKEAHGLKGELKVFIFSKDFSWAAELEQFSLQSPSGEKRDFHIKNIRPTPEFLLIMTEELKDRTQAEAVHGWSFAVEDEIFVSKPGETIFLSEILNFMLKDPAGETLGQIVGFSSNGYQDLLQIKPPSATPPEKEVVFEVPFVEEFLKKIDFKKQIVIMDLPEGLFDPDLASIRKS